MSMQPEVTFFVPCYNEEAAIERALGNIVETSERLGLSFEVLVFDDCSEDATLERARKFCADHPAFDIKIVANTRRMGLGYNYVEGAFRGQGKHYMLINGDGDLGTEQMIRVLSHLGKADVIIPYLDPDSRGGLRRRLSKFFTFILNLASGLHLQYYNAPVLHLRYNVMRWHPDTMGFAYQAELLTRLLGLGCSFQEIGIANNEQEGRVSKALSLQNFLSVTHSIAQIVFRRLRRALYGI